MHAQVSAPTVAEPQTAPSRDLPLRRALRPPLLEALALLASPLAAFFGLHVASMMRPGMIDPYLYTAYAQNGPDLITRYGDHFYYWVRLGFLLPARASYLAFGAVPGFYVLRYLLALVAVVPVYLLLRRLHGRAAGALAVAVVLSSPVVLRAWGTDYPDSAATSYLFAGTACLAMPAASRRGRLLWVTVAGLSLSLALHSQAISAPLIAALVLAYAAVHLRRAPLDTLAHLGLMALCALAVTGGLAALAQQVFGSSDIITPTLRAARHFQTPREVAKWHSTNWRWVLSDPYLLVLPAVVAGWCIARLGRGRSAPPAELAVVVAVALQGLAYTWLQFFGNSATLEYYFYSSMLWPGVCLVSAFLLVALCAPLLRRAATAALPAALVVLLALVIAHLNAWVQFEIVPVGALVVAGVLALVLVSRLVPGNDAVTATVVALVVAGCFALTIGKPHVTQRLQGQTKLPQVRYDMVIGGDGRAELDSYRVASKLHLVVPPARFRGDDLMVWRPPVPGNRLNEPAAQYLWNINSLRVTMPDLRPADVKVLRERRPRLLVLLSDTGREFPSALRSLSAASFEPAVLRTDVLTGTSQRLHVWVVELGSLAPSARPVATGRSAPTARR
ncbi:MAG TPA: glycosyltransferase family 39 protein [Actinomycetes bacterium]|nr:glycosyltransferase family 39 protein [Actinomycetes bacterium]